MMSLSDGFEDWIFWRVDLPLEFGPNNVHDSFDDFCDQSLQIHVMLVE